MHIKVRVTANARKEKIERLSPDRFAISLKEKAENNMANERLLEIISQLFKGKSVRFVRGSRSPNKLFEII